MMMRVLLVSSLASSCLLSCLDGFGLFDALGGHPFLSAALWLVNLSLPIVAIRMWHAAGVAAEH